MAKPSTTSTKHLFQKKGESARHVTSERIAEDLKAFRKGGGRIEVLGPTRVLTRIDAPGVQPEPAKEVAARSTKSTG